MQKIQLSDLYSLEEYSIRRDAFRNEVIEHKKARQLSIGDNLRLYFEDRLTMLYQLQEMLRIEKIFEVAEINQELDAYNPLIPDGTNWKATMMMEYPDIEVRKQNLSRLIGIEQKVWVQADGFDKVYPVANEDLISRETEEKTSAVHFLRFELSPDMVQAIQAKVPIYAGVDHPNYVASVTIPPNVCQSLAGDLD